MHKEIKISAVSAQRKKQAYPLSLKSVDASGRFAGYASVFNVLDNQHDVILPGAFADSLKSGQGREVKLLWQHYTAEPIGVFDAMFEDARGLYVEGRLLLQVQRAREAYALLKEGALRGLSIGYSPVHYTLNADTGARIISSVKLWEVSLVTFPANEAAGITVVKSSVRIQDSGFSEENTFPPEQLIALSDALENAAHILRQPPDNI